ncbi:10896_t:CDS:2, partial [Racocetra fulgida]
KKIALQYPDNEKNIYIEAAKQLRHPYWDWTDDKALIEGKNPNDKPNYTPPVLESNPFTPAGYPTIRHPNANYEDQNNLLNGNVTTYVTTVFRPGWYQVFQFGDFLRFSHHGIRPDGSQMPNYFGSHPPPTIVDGFKHYASLEAIHDAFHVAIGGPGGHMAYVDLASYDPIFNFHHVFLDRNFALWQEVFPDSWVPQTNILNGSYTQLINEVVDDYTDLTPFRKTKTEFWKSYDVRDVEKLGHTYLELEKFKGQDPKKLQAYLLELYKPDPLYGERFFVKVILKSNKLIGPYSVRVFLDYDADAQTPLTSPNFAGIVAMWSGHKSHSPFVVGTVDITAAMERLGIRMQTHDVFNDVNTTTGLLSPHAIFDVERDIHIVTVRLNGEGVSPKEAGVVKIEVYSFRHDKIDPNFLAKDT